VTLKLEKFPFSKKYNVFQELFKEISVLANEKLNGEKIHSIKNLPEIPRSRVGKLLRKDLLKILKLWDY